MLRCTIAALGLLLVSSCAKGPPTDTLSPIVTDTVSDQDAQFQVNLSWRAINPEEVELVVKMTAIGIEQTDKLVVDIKTNGFVITSGVPDWVGFVLPREKYTHRASYKMLEGVDQGRAEITIRHTVDSSMIWDSELLFERTDSGVRLAQ